MTAVCPITRREGAVLLIGLPLTAVLLITFAGAASLFTRHLWLDEVYTHALVADPELGHMMQALADGVETHPPTFYFLLRAFTGLAGTSNASLRAFSALCTLATATAVYLMVRRIVAPLPAVVGVAAVVCQPVMLHYSVEARHYALWVAETAWLAWALGHYRERRAARRPVFGAGLLLAAIAMLVCTTHYFGLFSWGLVLAGAFLIRPLPGATRWAGLLPSLAGPAALLTCIPLLLGQRQATTVATWVPGPDLGTLRLFVFGLLPVPTLVGVGILLTLLAAGRIVSQTRRLTVAEAPGPGPLASLAALALLPVVLVVFSYTLQSVLVDRYALPALLALAPLTAIITARLPRVLALVLLLLVLVGAIAGLRSDAVSSRARDWRADELIAALRRETEGPIVFERAHEVYLVSHAALDLGPRCFLLDLPAEQTTRARVFMRDLARRYAAWYGRPGLMAPEAFRALPRRYLVTNALDEAPTSPSLSGRVARPLGPGAYELQ